MRTGSTAILSPRTEYDILVAHIERCAREQPRHRTLVRKLEGNIKFLALAAILTLATATGANASCKSEATTKKLAGAALNSFTTKCESDAKAKCEADPDTKKLAGAARSSHMTKCVNDAKG